MKTKEETERLVRDYLASRPGNVHSLGRAYREGSVTKVCWLTEFLVDAIARKSPDCSKAIARACITQKLIEELEARL